MPLSSCRVTFVSTVLANYGNVSCLMHLSVSVEDQLYSEIKKLQEYRKNGITTFKGVLLFVVVCC